MWYANGRLRQLRLWIAVSLTPDTWFERVSMLVILLNCVTLGMFRPCEDIACDSQRCRILQVSVCVRAHVCVSGSWILIP